MKEGDVVVGRLIPADQDAPEAVQPAVRAFHHPAPGFEPSFSFDGLGLLAPAADVSSEAKLVQRASHLVKVVAFIQAHTLGLVWTGRRSRHGQAVHRGPHQFHVMTVGPVHRQTQKNVAQKRGLNRSILSQRWHAISQKLEYKSRWYGRQFVRVPAQYTSQSGPVCGNVDAGNRPEQAQFHCITCGTKTNADVIGGENIRRRGVNAMAGVGNSANRPAPVNRRTRKGTKQRTRALQRPLLMFTKTRI